MPWFVHARIGELRKLAAAHDVDTAPATLVQPELAELDTANIRALRPQPKSPECAHLSATPGKTVAPLALASSSESDGLD
jgi:hypothetical protein